MRAANGTQPPQRAQALEALNNQMSLSLEEIHTKLASEFAPRMTQDFEDTIEVLKKRIINIEWKMMCRKADVCLPGESENAFSRF
jgi:hypothetical protein